MRSGPIDASGTNPSPNSMDFMEFVTWSQNIAQAYPNVRLFCETRLSKAFQEIRPNIVAPVTAVTTHRCDLARQWCDVHGVSPDRAKMTLICDGVRHGLALIFEILAQQCRRIAIPQDVYPVYWAIASNAGIQTLGMETFPDFDLQSIFDQMRATDTSVILLPGPLKLQGRKWTDQEFAWATSWLREKAHRQLILDGIYSLGSPLDLQTRLLLETEQVLYLNSLSKGWLHEKIFGVAIVPANDFDLYAEAFRSLPARQENLFCAREMLTSYRHVPVILAKRLAEKREALLRVVKEAGLNARPVERGYFVPIEASVSSLLRNHRILAIPATAFGSKLSGWSVASTLSMTERP